MKICLLSFLFLLWAFSVRAGSPSLEAHEIGTKDTFRSNWETDWGSYDRDYFVENAFSVTVRDLSRKTVRCDVVAYFVARRISPSDERFIYDRKEFSPEFRGRIDVAGPVTAGDLRARIVNLADFGARNGNGADMDGWIVVGKLDGRPFDIKASSQTLLEMAQDSDRQPQTLTQMIGEYARASSKTIRRND